MNAEQVWDSIVDGLTQDAPRAELNGMMERLLRLECKVRECGECDHWMKRNLCPRENGSALRGSPTNGSLACGQFTMSDECVRG